MTMFAIKTVIDLNVTEAVTEANERLNKGDNPALVYLKGKVSSHVKDKELYVIFNIRQTIGFLKPSQRLTTYAFKKALREKGYFDKHQEFTVIKGKDFEEFLEGYI